jgi:hypothetical protein
MASTTLEFLNTNSGAIQAVSTIVLVFVTYWYVRLTRNLVRESSNARLDARLPILEPFDIYGPTRDSGSDTGHILEIKLKNIGYGPALYIRLVLPDSIERRVENLPEGESGRYSLPIKEEQIQKFADLPKASRTIYIKYSDVFGREIVTWLLFDSNEHENASQKWITYAIDTWHLLLPNQQSEEGLVMPPGLTSDLLSNDEDSEDDSP